MVWTWVKNKIKITNGRLSSGDLQYQYYTQRARVEMSYSSYCPIFVGSLHSTCTREHKNLQFEPAGVRKLSAKQFSIWFNFTAISQ
jgi:hypothetical protein